MQSVWACEWAGGKRATQLNATLDARRTMKELKLSAAARDAMASRLALKEFPSPIPWLTLGRWSDAPDSSEPEWTIVYCDRTPEMESAIVRIDGTDIICYRELLTLRRTRSLLVDWRDGHFRFAEQRDEQQ